MSKTDTKVSMLVVTHANGNQHLALPGLADSLEHQNSKRPESKRWTIELREMTEQEIKDFKPFNPNHKPATANDAAKLRAVTVEQKLQIDDLQKRIAELEAKKSGGNGEAKKKAADTKTPEPPKANGAEKKSGGNGEAKTA